MKANPKSIDRSFQNHKNEVVETDVPKSGENLTYRSHVGGLVLGRLYPQGHQHLLPNTKFSGSHEASLTFEQLSTPVVDDVDVCVHNFFVTYRSIDNRWEKFQTPSKLNNMNYGVSVPMFDLKPIFETIFGWISRACTIITIDGTRNSFQFRIVGLTAINWDNVYHSDCVLDLMEQLKSITGSSYILDVKSDDIDSIEKFRLILYTIFDFFVGKRSLLDYLGYKYVSHSDIDTWFNIIYPSLADAVLIGNNVYYWLTNQNGYTYSKCIFFGYNSDDDCYDFANLAPILQNEYALRAYYAIWFEYYRNYDLEPRSASLPEYREFGSSSIFLTYDKQYLHYLVPRIRSWQQDAFTTAGIDDISRHVFAPILDNANFIMTPDSDLQPSGQIDNSVIVQKISWRNPATGVSSTLDVPVPSRLCSLLQKPASTITGADGLELFSLRKAAMLENYLKRIYYGGDEYRDRMLHIFGARIEDYRINRPQWLSSSMDTIDPKQEVANTGVKPGDSSGFSIGERLATATAKQSGNDGFTEFAPEHGIFISMLSIMPHATYDPYILQNLYSTFNDYPIPQFANQMEDVISTLEISRGVDNAAFGYAPYGHPYRYRVDEVHGDYHDEKYDYVFQRFFNNDSIPNLSWSFIHCRPKLPMFVNSILLDGQVYGTIKQNFLVEQPLPSPVETI